jgi:hypothetical protein
VCRGDGRQAGLCLGLLEMRRHHFPRGAGLDRRPSAMCGGNACVAVTEGKQVYAWSDPDDGGTAPDEVQALTDVTMAMCGRDVCVSR